MVGVYGDDLQHSDTNSELVPLLKRLISLLQESGSIISTTRSPGHYPPAKDGESRASRLMVNKGQTSLPSSNISYECKE